MTTSASVSTTAVGHLDVGVRGVDTVVARHTAHRAVIDVHAVVDLHAVVDIDVHVRLGGARRGRTAWQDSRRRYAHASKAPNRHACSGRRRAESSRGRFGAGRLSPSCASGFGAPEVPSATGPSLSSRVSGTATWLLAVRSTSHR